MRAGRARARRLDRRQGATYRSAMARPTLAARLAAIARQIGTEYPHLLADEARRAAGRARDRDFGFGLTPPATMVKLLRRVRATRRDVVVDLGSGVGQAVLAAALVCREAHGHELLQEMVQVARRTAKALAIGNARFHAGDLRRARVGDATVLYSYSTCFGPPLMEALGRTAARAKDGARIITVTNPLEHPEIELISWARLPWGIPGHTRTVYFHVRRRRRRARLRA